MNLPFDSRFKMVLMEHPPKQGLKHLGADRQQRSDRRFNGTSTKTRIETKSFLFRMEKSFLF